MGEQGDADLVEQFRATGDARHFDDLVRRHIGSVRAMIYPMVLNDADADELTQEVFLRVVRNIARFRQQARFSTWLYRIAMNTTYSFLKRRKAAPAVDCGELPEQTDPAADASAALVHSESDARVHKALATLSPTLRSAIVLTGIQGMSVKDAARAAGCLAATMYWRVHEARRILRGKLDLEAER